MIENILDNIYPRTCGFCNRICKEGICSKCNTRIAKWKEITIYNNSDFNLARHLYAFRYEGEIRQKIIEYKFGEKSYLYETFVNLLLKEEIICEFLKSYDIMIAIPISKKRKKQRGYNQSELVAKGIVKRSPKLTLESKILLKIKDNIPQSSLNKQERKQNVKGTYQVQNKAKIENKNIVLLDDIYTTGSTIEECATVLKKAGVKEVAAITIAKD